MKNIYLPSTIEILQMVRECRKIFEKNNVGQSFNVNVSIGNQNSIVFYTMRPWDIILCFCLLFLRFFL